MSIDEEAAKQIGLPESNRLKYEPLLPSASELGRVICAFANTEGGTLILGVLSKNNKISVIGLSADFQVNVVLTNAISKLSPTPSIKHDFIQYDDKKLFIIKVQQSNQEISFNQKMFSIRSKKIFELNSTKDLAKNEESKNTDKFLDEILKYLIDNPGLINVNKHTIREAILNNKVNVSDAAQMISRLIDSGHVNCYGDRYIGASIDTKSFLDKGGFTGSLTKHVVQSSKKIFISYNWNHKGAANNLYEFLKDKEYTPSMDDHNLAFKDSISTFMESIRASDFAVLIISDEYLKSENCMIEVLHMLKDRNSHDKILPIRHENVKIFKPSDRIKYIEFWKLQVEERESMLKGIDPTVTIEEIRKLKNAKRIHQDIGDFLSDVADMISNTIEEQEKTSYKNIINYIEKM